MMKMLSDSKTVLIVVSSEFQYNIDNEAENEEILNEHDNIFKTMTPSNNNHSDWITIENHTDLPDTSHHHATLMKNYSYPLERAKQKDLLSVPSSALFYNTEEESLYGSWSSIDSMYCNDCASESTLRKTASCGNDRFPCIENEMKCASANNLHHPGYLTPKTRYGNGRLGSSHQLHQTVLRTNSVKAAKSTSGDSFIHKSLKRTISAPLKTSKENVNQTDSKDSGASERRNDSPSSNQPGNYFNIFSPKVWKRSFLKMNDEKGGSRFSLRRTFSLRSSASGHTGEGGHITFPSKKKKTQKYRIIEAKTGQPDGISFELLNKQGCFLRVKGSELIPDRDNGSDTNFNKDVTFVPLPDMWFSSFFAFESVSKPSYFIRLLSTEEELVIDKYDGTKAFKEDASFRLNKKPDATCLKKDVQAWVKSNSGEYYLGKILFVNDELVKVVFSDGRQERCLRSESYKLIPDIVPCPSKLRVGIRVISQFGHRHRLYPGVISSVRRNDSYDILFDDGDFGRGKSYQMRLLKDFPVANDDVDTQSNKENQLLSSHPPLKAVLSDPLKNKEYNQECPLFCVGSPTLSDSRSTTMLLKDPHTSVPFSNDTGVSKHMGIVETNGNNDRNSNNEDANDNNNNINISDNSKITISINNDKPDEDIIKSPAMFSVSRLETENDNQDNGYHYNSKHNGSQHHRHQNGHLNNDKNWLRRRKHGWVPSPLATDDSMDEKACNGLEKVPMLQKEQAFDEMQSPPIQTYSPLLDKKCQHCHIGLTERNCRPPLSEILINPPSPMKLRKSSALTKSFSEEEELNI